MSDIHASLSTRVERRFYVVVRWFGLMLASLLFLMSAFLGIISARQFTRVADNQIHPPTITYSDFSAALEKTHDKKAMAAKDNSLQAAEKALDNAQANAEFERKLKPHLDAIIVNLNQYASIIQIGKPNEKSLGDFVRNNMQEIKNMADDAMEWKYVESLRQATADLAADADRLAKLSSEDSQPLRWDDFLQAYTEIFKHQIDAEVQRVDNEHIEIASDKISALKNLAIAGGLFFAFVITTVLLVLLRIEKNTRPEHENS